MRMCDKKHYIISIMAVFLYLYVYEFIVHGILLNSAYISTKAMWREPDDIQALMPLIMMRYLILSILFVILFKYACRLGYRCSLTNEMPSVDPNTTCPIKSGGLCFGTVIGLIMGTNAASLYTYMPIPTGLGFAWFFAGLGAGVGVGLILPHTYKTSKGQSSS